MKMRIYSDINGRKQTSPRNRLQFVCITKENSLVSQTCRYLSIQLRENCLNIMFPRGPSMGSPPVTFY